MQNNTLQQLTRREKTLLIITTNNKREYNIFKMSANVHLVFLNGQ